MGNEMPPHPPYEEGVLEDVISVPLGFILCGNYPNPFKPSTTIMLGVPEQSYINLCIYDLLGREVARIVDGIFSEGYHKFTWSGKTDEGQYVGSGIFFYRINATSVVNGRNFTQIRAMVLIK